MPHIITIQRVLTCLLVIIATNTYASAAETSRYKSEVDSMLCNATYEDIFSYLETELGKPIPDSEAEISLRYADFARLASRIGLWETSLNFVSNFNLDATSKSHERYKIIDAIAANLTLHMQGYIPLDVKYSYAPLILKYETSPGSSIFFAPHFQHLFGIELLRLGQYSDALTNFREALDGFDISKFSSTELDLRIRLIQTYDKCGQYEDAQKQLEAYEQRVKQMCSDNSLYVAIMHQLHSQVSLSLGDISNAERSLIEAFRRYDETDETDTGGYPALLLQLGILSMTKEDYTSALTFFEESHASAEIIFGEKGYASVAADIYKLDALLALRREDEYDTLWEKTDKKLSEETKDISLIFLHTHQYMTFANSMINLGAYGLARMILKLTEDLYSSIEAGSPIEYRDLYNALGYLSVKSDDQTEAAKYFRRQLDMDRRYAHDVFMFLPEAQRAKYWARMEPLMNRLFSINRNGTATLTDGTVIEIKSQCDTIETGALLYDASLLNKGLMLEASVNLRQLLKDSGNDELLGMANELSILRRRQASGVPLTPQENERATRIETTIMKESRQYGDFMQFASFTWQDIRDCLSEHEVAVEFVMSREKDIEYYSAELVRNTSQSPEHIFLFALNKGDRSLENNNIYTTRTIYNKVWKKVLQHVSPGETIYFSPTGKLYSIAIEHVPVPSGARMDTQYTPIRLSSTRELVMKRPEYTNTGTVLYGGLNYDTDIEDMELVAQTIDTTRGIARSIDGDFSSRKAWNYLPGTMAEVKAIADTHESAHIDSRTLLTGNEGTEESFKRFSGAGTQILHIATHGFYLPPKETDGIVTANYTVDDNSLYRSALVLSGGNNGWLFPDLIPDNLDDGILTAKEISEMDLSGTDLVVMSACQTGLGDVSNEGVFGLQRAFKLAGARTLIMSLAPIHDDATRMLMSEFYRALIQGESLRDAFAKGQKAVQSATFTIGNETLPGSDPRFWAPFVIMD